jgi:malate dehydrogenase
MVSHVIVALTGAAGNIAASFLPLLLSGYIFGNDVTIDLRLLEIPEALSKLKGVCMELEDAAYTLLQDIRYTTDPLEAFVDADVVILAGGHPRRQDMQRKDLIQVNSKIFQRMGQALHQVAPAHVKVLCVANPANTNCLVMIQSSCTQTSRIPTRNFCALTYLDWTRAKSMIATKLRIPVKDVKNVIVWGNHSSTQYPDVLSDGYQVTKWGERITLRDSLKDDIKDEKNWLEQVFQPTIRERGQAILKQRGTSSAMSAAQAIADCLRTWLVIGTAEGETVSMAIYNDAEYYGVQKGIVFSFPCHCRNGDWSVKTDIELDDESRRLIKLSEQELIEEQLTAMNFMSLTSKL